MRQEYLEKEQASWVGFLQAVETVPAERRRDPGVVPGWSVHDLVWHCAGWANFAAENLEQMKAGTFVDPWEGVPDSHWDEVSQRQIDEAKDRSFEDVLAEAERAHIRLRTIWSELPEIDDEAASFFADEGFVHYDEHADEIRRFVETV
jgi:hypothetical protein